MSTEGDPGLLYQIGGVIGVVLVGIVAGAIGVIKGIRKAPDEKREEDRQEAEHENRVRSVMQQDDLRRVQAELDTANLLKVVGEEFEAVRTEFRQVTEAIKDALHTRMSNLGREVKNDIEGLREDVHRLDVTVAGLKGKLDRDS